MGKDYFFNKTLGQLGACMGKKQNLAFTSHYIKKAI